MQLKKRVFAISVSGDNGIMCGVQSLLFELIYNLVDNADSYITKQEVLFMFP